METELCEVRAESRVRAGYPEVGGARETEAAADGGTLHGGHDRQRGVEQPGRLGAKMLRAPAGAAVAAEVGAGAEVLPLGAKHDDSRVRGRGEVQVEIGDAADHRQIEEVVRWTAQLDGRHTVVDGRAHTVLLVEHTATLSGRPERLSATIRGSFREEWPANRRTQRSGG